MNIKTRTLALLFTFAIVMNISHAYADNENVKNLIGGIIGLGLEQIEQGNQISSQSYGGALELDVGDERANYFIVSKYKNAVKQGLELSSQSMTKEAFNSLQSLDVRGLKLMSSYEEALKFTQSENSVCQSILSNFHSVYCTLERLKEAHYQVADESNERTRDSDYIQYLI